MKKWLGHEITGKDEIKDNVEIESSYAESLMALEETSDVKQIVAEERSVDPKIYWVPIPTDEMNKAPQ